MLAQPKNRVQAIKSKFESLKTDTEVLVVRKKSTHLNKQDTNVCKDKVNGEIIGPNTSQENRNDSDSDEWSPKPNSSYLYSKNEVKRSLSETKPTLVRQTSDPCKKLYRSHAFRCDRSQIINQSPKRHGSCNGRSETSDFTIKMGDKKLSKERLKQLGNFLEVQMKKENFCPLSTSSNDSIAVGEVNELSDSIPDSQVPKHILDQYAKVLKNKNKAENRQDSMTDSGVSSETEIVEDDKFSKIKKLVSQYEKSEVTQESKVSTANLESMNDLCASSETMKLERKNPHLILTDTLKKALKQPLPPGPPPKKPPRTFAGPSIPESPENNKKDAKKMLEKLEQVLQKREAQIPIQSNNIYDIAETDQSVNKPKEMHYLCTEILDITHRSLTSNNQKDPFSKCFNSLNCAIITNNSTLSLPYTRLSSHNRESLNICCSNENLDTNNLSTFLSNKCLKCQTNDKTDGFKCRLNCDCKEKKSEFFVKKEHIYDVPFVDKSLSNDNQYGTLNSLKLHGSHSRSMEDLQSRNFDDDQKIYDVPCEVSRPPTPDLIKSDFQKLRDNFENATQKTVIQPINLDAKTADAKTMSKKVWKSSENVTEDFKNAKRQIEKKFATDIKRYKKNDRDSRVALSLPKRESQLDVDRENLNRLMTEIYETVKAACNMDENKPGSFPTDLSDANSDESVTLTRSLTEKRKNYVRRVSSRVAYLDKNVKSRFRHQTSICSYKSEILDNPYSTFRSWKSFRTSQSNLARDKMERHDSTDSKINLTDSSGNILSIKDMVSDDSLDNLSIDEKTGCVDIDLPFVPRDKGLFNICLLVGLNYMTGEAYVKSVFPSQVQVPPHIENLIFPETISSGTIGEWATETAAQCYSLVLTDERGERAYGYCRRVLPEGATTCLPLCYCLIGKYRAPGFYYKVLQEIESHHGNSEVEINQILQQLFETDFPNPGEQISITYTNASKDKTRGSMSLGDIHKCKTMPDPRRNESTTNVSVRKDLTETGSPKAERESETENHELPEYYDLENNNRPRLLSLETPRIRIIKRPLDPRADEDNVSILLDTFGAGLLIKVFGSLLLERKVIVMGDELSVISSCMEALQSALYPFVWQQPLISTIPSQIQRDVLTAPLPILAAMLSDHNPAQIEEGMLIDLAHPSKVLFYQGDESTILPTASYKTLKTSLHMESIKHKDKHEDTKTRNVMISEAFLRFFVDILGDFWKFFSDGEVGDSDLGKNGVVFDKEAFIKNSSSKQVQYFLEWFTETAMFNHFIQNMATCYHDLPLPNDYINKDLVDTPLPNFYELFHERVKSRSKTQNQKSDSKLNYKSAVNKKVKMLKTKLRDLVA
ncbi:uncharacterized protein LOC126778788 [Nymphalis io]|uniref:uncharacterized protein LOC126778788 n=1 Tax=Inachis io TaxID=171585 RepID=UPI002166D01D|nr:uncharacterized protein LOC126778788 [Nymphalis io]